MYAVVEFAYGNYSLGRGAILMAATMQGAISTMGGGAGAINTSLPTVIRGDPAFPTAALSLNNNGSYSASNYPSADTTGGWVAPQSSLAASFWEVRATKTAGSATSSGSALSTWWDFSTSRAFSTSSASATMTLTLEWRLKDGDGTVLYSQSGISIGN